MSAPRSSSASARSLSLMSTPLTRATTGSEAETGAGASDDVSFEQPDAASTVNSTAAMAAYPIRRLYGGEWGSRLREGMGESWLSGRKAEGKKAGHRRGTSTM